MSTTPVHKWEVFHRITLRGVLIAVVVLPALSVSWRMHLQAKPELQRISCVNNFKHVGTAYRVGVNDWPNLDFGTNIGH
jgi:hypothetical protein